MKLDQLESAIEYRDRLKSLLTFREGLWDGPVNLTFGSYHMSVTVKCCREELEAVIAKEERMIRNTLDMMGVTVDD